jgi:hypothetical protein
MASWNHFAFAGLAKFNPPVALYGSPGETVSVDLILQAQDLPEFNSADLIVSSTMPFQWEYSSEFLAKSSTVQSPVSIDLGIAPYDLYVGGLSSASFGSYGHSILMGTLTFHTTYDESGANFFVDSESDGNFSNIARDGVAESLIGGGQIICICPESGSLLILSLGAIVLICKRRGTS